jgi:hypothetical protein
MIKRFCLLTFDKYLHGRNRAKGEGDPNCQLCGLTDSLGHIFSACSHHVLGPLRFAALHEMTALIDSWRETKALLPLEEEVWLRFLSNVTRPLLYAEECWTCVHNDASLSWMFGEDFLISPLSTKAQSLLLRRCKDIFRLRRRFADEILLLQQRSLLARPRACNARRRPAFSFPLPPSLPPLRRHPLPPREYALPNRRLPPRRRRQGAIPIPTSLTSIVAQDTPRRRKRKKKHRHCYIPITRFFHVMRPLSLTAPSAVTESLERYASRSFGSADILDPPD